MNEQQLKEAIAERYETLKALEQQDESNFSDFEISVKGKEVNSRLVRNHIIYYKKQLDKLKTRGLNKWV